MSMEDKFSALIGRLEAVTTKLEAGSGGGGGGGGGGAAAAADDGAVSPSVRAFDDLIAKEVTAYVAAAAAIGDATVLAQAETCKQAFEAQRAMLLVVSKAAKPSQADFTSKCIPPTSDKLGEVQAKVDRRSKNYNALQAMGEAIPALGWVMVEKTPGPHVADSWESGAYYVMKLQKEFKGVDENQMKLASTMKAIFTTLQARHLPYNPKP